MPERLGDRPAGVRVPEPGGPVPSAGDRGPAVGALKAAIETRAVVVEGGKRSLPVAAIPEPRPHMSSLPSRTRSGRRG